MYLHITHHAMDQILKRTDCDDEKEAKWFAIHLFKKLYYRNAEGVKIFRKPDGSCKLTWERHKLVFKKMSNSEFVLITYIYKRDQDKKEHHLLNSIKYGKYG